MNILSDIFNLIKELLYYIGSLCAKLIGMAYEWFMAQSFLNKLVLGNIFLAMIAIVAPIVKYRMWDTWQGVNNPYAFFLIVISAVMFGTMFLPGTVSTAARIILNAWFLIDLLISWWTHSISRAPYVLSWGFILNLLVPVIFISLSLMIQTTES